jgi:transposase
MRETITMTAHDQQRAMVLTRLLAGELTLTQAAELVGLSERQVRRLADRFRDLGPAGLAHGNRGRPSVRRVPEEVRRRVLRLADGPYDGANDCHLADLLAEREDIVLSRVTVRRLLREAHRPPTRRRRAPAHRSRRERLPAEGMLVQLDGSDHDWLEGRGPRLCLLAAVDDATSRVVAATFRDEEDAAGYLGLLLGLARSHGLPVAVYHDRAGSFEQPEGRLPPEELRIADTRRPTQLGRALGELGIRSIAARSPQAKGRVERGFGTHQDRLVTELRIAGVDTRAEADAFLSGYLERHNRRFAVVARDPVPAWRPVPAGLEPEAVLCFRYSRVVANDHTVRVGGLVLELPPLVRGQGYAGRRVQVQLRVDGTIVVVHHGEVVLVTAAPQDPGRLRSLTSAAARLTRPSPAPLGYPPGPDHPWRRATPGSRLEAIRADERRVTRSRTS